VRGKSFHLQPPATSLRPAIGRRGFTLVELLITVSIIAMLAGMILFALYRAQETAREQKTRALIARLDAIVKSKWESYKTRRVPITVPPNTPPLVAARMRLDGLRDLMRMEMPERYTDVVEVTDLGNNTVIATNTKVGPVAIPAEPAVWRTYYRRIDNAIAAGQTPNWDHQSAEMLYLIVTASAGEDGDTADVFKPDNVGDIDGDGMPEFIDGWGRPIRFLRWAPGFVSDLHVIARGIVERVDGVGSKEIIVTARGAGLSRQANAYVGGTIVRMDKIGGMRFAGKHEFMARITGYSNPTGIATFICATPSYTQQKPFSDGTASSPPDRDDEIGIMAPDGFDPMGVYPVYSSGSSPPVPNTSVPSFALYPLIYSAGPDGAFGVVGESPDSMSNHPLKYAANALHPFHPQPEMIGTQGDTVGDESTPRAWVDNIHNHLQGLR
jgi:prepilin-type N-terminal cleavage/methylation domain-containing protein